VSFIYYYDDKQEKRLNIWLHMIFLLEYFSSCVFLCVIADALLRDAILSCVSLAEFLVFVTLQTHLIFLVIILLLSSFQTARTNIAPFENMLEIYY
jgi:hypothetical protein